MVQWSYNITSVSFPTYAAAAAKSLQSCLTLCDPIDGSPPGFPIPGILQARTLEWVAIVWLLATPWTAAYQASLPMGFSRQEYWSGLPLPSLFSCVVMSNSLQLHELQHTRLPSPSRSPGICSNSCPWNQWCHLTISSSVTPFSFCLLINGIPLQYSCLENPMDRGTW